MWRRNTSFKEKNNQPNVHKNENGFFFMFEIRQTFIQWLVCDRNEMNEYFIAIWLLHIWREKKMEL